MIFGKIVLHAQVTGLQKYTERLLATLFFPLDLKASFSSIDYFEKKKFS